MSGTLPAFATWKDNYGGLGICVHDVWATNVEIVDYTFDGKYYSGTLKFTLYDHFGLDSEDITEGFGVLAGFRSWFVLQRFDYFDGKYKPFVDIMEFEVDLRGSV